MQVPGASSLPALPSWAAHQELTEGAKVDHHGLSGEVPIALTQPGGDGSVDQQPELTADNPRFDSQLLLRDVCHGRGMLLTD